MAQGSAGLSKRANNSSSDESADVALAPVQARSPRHGALHVVEVDRLAFDRRGVRNDRYLAPPERGAYSAFKRVFDIAGASLAILLLSPLIIGIILCSYGTRSGSPFYRHRRIGKAGVPFHCLKFRTMVKNADKLLLELLTRDHRAREEWLRDHKLRADPRVTRFGRFLRKTSLDELPQLWNVLRGEMSLVGPRPVVPDELDNYGYKVSTYLRVRPGITGLWQVSGRNDISYRRRVALDVYYVRSRSLRLDLYILVKTLPIVIVKTGAY